MVDTNHLRLEKIKELLSINQVQDHLVPVIVLIYFVFILFRWLELIWIKRLIAGLRMDSVIYPWHHNPKV